MKPVALCIILVFAIGSGALATSAASTEHLKGQVALQLGAIQMGYSVPFALKIGDATNAQQAANALVMGRNALAATVARPALKVLGYVSSPSVNSVAFREQLKQALEAAKTSPVIGGVSGRVSIVGHRKQAVVYATLKASLPAPAITSATSANGAVGTAFSYQITAANNPTSYGATGLPTGLTVNTATGLISGTPSAAWNSSVLISAANSVGTGSATLTLNISGAPEQTDTFVTVAGGTLPQPSDLAGQQVSTFQIGKYEVTWDEWQRVRTWAIANGYSDLWAGVWQGSGRHPILMSLWHEAAKWCNARSEMEGLTPAYRVNGAVYRIGRSEPTWDRSANGYRLPTESEWEWAARGGVMSQGYTYSGSNDIYAVAWHYDNSGGATVELWSGYASGRGTWPVGLKAANELGIHDMSGNVYEWCWEGAEEWFSGYQHFFRGGSCIGEAFRCELAYRTQNISSPDREMDAIGLRLARNAP